MDPIDYNTNMELVGILLIAVGLIVFAEIINKYIDKKEKTTNKNIRCNLINEPHKWERKTDQDGNNPYMQCSVCQLNPNLMDENE